METLHPLVILLILVSSKCKFLDCPLRLPQILAGVSKPPGFSIKLRLQLTDASLHLDHSLSTSLKSRDLSLISTGGSILTLSLKNLLVLLQVHGQVLLTSKFISKTCCIHHGTGSLILRQSCLVRHFIQVSIQLVMFSL